ncbi:uncharacterized protein LOC144304690 [Canis aureus]
MRFLERSLGLKRGEELREDKTGGKEAEKPLHQRGPGEVARFLAGTAALVLILGVALAVLFLHRRQQERQLEVEGGGTALPTSQEPEPPPDRQSHRAPEDIQVLHLEPGKQLLQQEQEVEQLPLQPPYYDLGTSPSYRPSVRTAQPQPPDKAPPTQLHPAWPRAQLPGWKEDTGSPGDRAGRAQIGAHQGGEGWPFMVAPQQVPWAKQGLDAVRPGRGCGPDALLSPHQACISALGPANDHPKAGSSPSSWPQSQVLGGPASP